MHRNQIKKTSRLQKLVLFGATFDPEQFALISPSREPNPYIFIDKTWLQKLRLCKGLSHAWLTKNTSHTPVVGVASFKNWKYNPHKTED